MSLILINTPSLCSTSLQLTMLKGMVPLCGIGLRVHCFSKIKRLYFRELFLVQVLCYKVSSAPSSLIVDEQIQKTQKEEACASWIDTIYFIYCIKNPKSICVKNVRCYKTDFTEHAISDKIWRVGSWPPWLFLNPPVGVLLRHNLRSLRLFVPLFFSSMCWLNFHFLLHF